MSSCASWTGRAWSCTVRLVVTDPRALRPASQDLVALLRHVDAAASRFRPDSALSVTNARAGRPAAVSRLLIDLVSAALEAAARTDGAVDPTVGTAMRHIGYDRDITAIRDTTASDVAQLPAPGGAWRRVQVYRETGLITVPLGYELDLGATAKAWTADHAARTLAQRYSTGVLVELGGDLAVAGAVPRDGWRIRVAEREGGSGQVVMMRHGGIATSTTTVRHWTKAGRPMHHIVDPRTGLPANGPWRTVSVHHKSALAANIASTATIVRGTVPDNVVARLVAQDGTVTTVGGWPSVVPATDLAGVAS